MDLNELRALVRQRHNAATRKVSRLRGKDVEVGGTKFDPRRDPSNIKRYTRAQLNAYLGQLNNFTARTTGFVAGVEGTPLPRAKWREYERQQNAANAKARARAASIGNVKLPGQDMTVAQRSEMMRPNILRAGGEASNRPYAEVNRKPSQIKDVDALNKLIQSFKRKNRPEYLPKYLKGQRKQAEQMMATIGVADQIPELRKLSDHQFDTLFNESSFAGDLGMRYGYMSMLDKGNKSAAHDAVMETTEHDIAEKLSWAKSLPKTTPQQKATRAKGR